MANRKQMENWLNEGKKVRRPNWNPESYWVLSNDECKRIVYSDGTPAKVHINQLEANDWEVVYEEFCLEDEGRIGGFIWGYHKKDVKKAISLFKSDLQKIKGHDGRVELKYAMKIIKKRFGERLSKK